MGCCIGKLRKGPKELDVNNGFHGKPDVSVDKVVITESPVLPQSDVAYSSSHLASSTSSLKDRTFSNEFLVSCLKVNPQVVTQLANIPSPSPTHSVHSSGTHPKVSVNRPKSADQPAFVFETRSLGRRPPQRLEWQKSPSPGTARRKCPISTSQDTSKYYASTKKAALLRSRSPSRRFNNNSTKPVSNYKIRRVGTSQQGSPFNDRTTSSVHGAPHRLRSPCSSSACSDSAGAYRQVSSSALIGEMECMTLEDLDNPLISLDCFIFL